MCAASFRGKHRPCGTPGSEPGDSSDSDRNRCEHHQAPVATNGLDPEVLGHLRVHLCSFAQIVQANPESCVWVRDTFSKRHFWRSQRAAGVAYISSEPPHLHCAQGASHWIHARNRLIAQTVRAKSTLPQHLEICAHSATVQELAEQCKAIM